MGELGAAVKRGAYNLDDEHGLIAIKDSDMCIIQSKGVVRYGRDAIRNARGGECG